MFDLPKLTEAMDAADLAAKANELRDAIAAADRMSGAMLKLASAVANFEEETGNRIFISPCHVGVDLAKPGSDETVVTVVDINRPVEIADEDVDDSAMPTCLRVSSTPMPPNASEIRAHLEKLAQKGGKWTQQHDLEMLDRAKDGQNVRDIAAVMEFSPSFIRQRFNLLVDTTHGQGNRFKRDDVLTVLHAISIEKATA
ncbi:hypothetical protein SAMN04489859_102030 [Paracoccus alcaliphilus]|uniref:Uncharacterized protein n=1 Tax=Paracoccus alcaliphilus TaxID=34002 RepID=A0A1H8K352_9RHOB|nr:hypothetical protein [Paracoccus alcaliphilus]WCR17527.1 hypothetical protein JHW40_14485 [Paracoccus alcaliphilus]SEN87382.1 hypothetical protein SAMN04489859_102030 [Paracoccus alcaliphilus]